MYISVLYNKEKLEYGKLIFICFYGERGGIENTNEKRVSGNKTTINGN